MCRDRFASWFMAGTAKFLGFFVSLGYLFWSFCQLNFGIGVQYQFFECWHHSSLGDSFLLVGYAF